MNPGQILVMVRQASGQAEIRGQLDERAVRRKVTGVSCARLRLTRMSCGGIDIMEMRAPRSRVQRMADSRNSHNEMRQVKLHHWGIRWNF